MLGKYISGNTLVSCCRRHNCLFRRAIRESFRTTRSVTRLPISTSIFIRSAVPRSRLFRTKERRYDARPSRRDSGADRFAKTSARDAVEENGLLAYPITSEITFYQLLLSFTPRFTRSPFLPPVSIIRESRSSRLRGSQTLPSASFIPPRCFGVIFSPAFNNAPTAFVLFGRAKSIQSIGTRCAGGQKWQRRKDAAGRDGAVKTGGSLKNWG